MIKYRADRKTAEEILLKTSRKYTIPISKISEPHLLELERRYLVKPSELEPRVFYRITDSWLELNLRFIAPDHNIRELKDCLSRDIVEEFEKENIEIASTTIDLVGLPSVPVRVKVV